VSLQIVVFRHLVGKCPRKQGASLLGSAASLRILVAVVLGNSLEVLLQLLQTLPDVYVGSKNLVVVACFIVDIFMVSWFWAVYRCDICAGP